MKIEVGKLYKTRDGKPVKIYAVGVSCLNGYSVHGAVLVQSSWRIVCWKSDGSYYGKSIQDDYDIVGECSEQSDRLIAFREKNYGRVILEPWDTVLLTSSGYERVPWLDQPQEEI